jgi:hypothetical protein
MSAFRLRIVVTLGTHNVAAGSTIAAASTGIATNGSAYLFAGGGLKRTADITRACSFRSERCTILAWVREVVCAPLCADTVVTVNQWVSAGPNSRNCIVNQPRGHHTERKRRHVPRLTESERNEDEKSGHSESRLM